jgi:peptide/nickel transport system permease protein
MPSYTRYVARRALRVFATLFLVVTFNFWLFHLLPGNYAQLAGRAGALDPKAVHSLKASYGLDKSNWQQYTIYLKKIVTFNWGTSFSSHDPVWTLVWQAFLNTLILVVPALVLMLIVGVLLGVVAGWRRGSKMDTTIVTTSLGLWSLPTFWFGMMLVLTFSVWLGGLPVAGKETYGAYYPSIFDKFYDVSTHLLLPMLTIAVVSVGQFVLIMRNSLADVRDSDYMVTARAKGIRPRRMLWNHAVPNAMLPTYTLAALNLGILISTTIQVETVFSWPGLGLLIYNAVNNRDYPVLEASFLLIAVVVVITNFLADLTYGLLDPRIEDT